jgi:hypothetical protein
MKRQREDLNYWKANAEEDYLHTPKLTTKI